MGAACRRVGASQDAAPLVAARVAAQATGRRAIPPLVARARLALREERRQEALDLLEAHRGLAEAEPERSWLLVAIWLDLEQRAEAAAATAAMGRGPVARALQALAAEDPARSLSLLASPTPDPEAWMALARCHVERRQANAAGQLAAGRAARASSNPFVRLEAALALLGAYLEAGQIDEALAIASEVASLAPDDARPWRARAAILQLDGQRSAAALSLVEALERAPGSEALAQALDDLWRRGPGLQLASPVAARLAALAERSGAPPSLLLLRGRLALAKGGDAMEAVAWLERARAQGAPAVPLDRDLGLAYARLGRFEEAATLLTAALPLHWRRHAANLLLPCWDALARAAREATQRPDSAPHRIYLAEAFIALGALDEAEAVLAATPDARALAALRRLQGHLAFEAALNDALSAGYRAANRERGHGDLHAWLGAVPGLARRHLAPDDAAPFANPRFAVSSLPLVATWLEHGVRTPDPLVRHFRRYGRYLVLGQRADRPVEAVLLSMGFLAEALPIATTGRRHRHDFVVGGRRGLDAFASVDYGEIAGACLPNGIWLDADACRRGSALLRFQLRADPLRLPVAVGLPPLAPDEDGWLDLDDPRGVTMRLLARDAREHGEDPWGTLATLAAHECGHVDDLRSYTPPLQRLPAVVGLLFAEGFSSWSIERRLERQAQLAAVIDSGRPHLAVAEMTAMLPVHEPEAEVHAAGYAAALQGMLQALARQVDRHPAIDRRARLLPQLDRLDAETLRALAWDAWRAGAR